MCLAHSESTQHAFLTLRTYYCTCTMCRAQVRGQEHQSQGRWGPGLVETPVVGERPINRQRNRVAKGNRDVGTDILCTCPPR